MQKIEKLKEDKKYIELEAKLNSFCSNLESNDRHSILKSILGSLENVKKYLVKHCVNKQSNKPEPIEKKINEETNLHLKLKLEEKESELFNLVENVNNEKENYENNIEKEVKQFLNENFNEDYYSSKKKEEIEEIEEKEDIVEFNPENLKVVFPYSTMIKNKENKKENNPNNPNKINNKPNHLNLNKNLSNFPINLNYSTYSIEETERKEEEENTITYNELSSEIVLSYFSTIENMNTKIKSAHELIKANEKNNIKNEFIRQLNEIERLEENRERIKYFLSSSSNKTKNSLQYSSFNSEMNKINSLFC